MNENFLIDAIACQVDGNRKPKTVTSLILEAGMDEFRRSKIDHLVTAGKSIPIPSNYRTALTGGSGAGVGTGVNLSTSPLEDKLIAVKLGATFLTGVKPNLAFPLPARIAVPSETETAGASDGGSALGSINFVPRLRLTNYIDVSKQLLMQADSGAEPWLMNMIIESVAVKLESYIFGKQASSATMIQGLTYAVTSGTLSQKATVVPQYSHLTGLESTLIANKAHRGKLGFATSGTGAVILKYLERYPGTGYPSLMENNMVNGFPCEFSNTVPDTCGTGGDGSALIFGAWDQLAIVQFGGFAVMPDPYSRALGNILRLTINSFFDVRGLCGTESTDLADATQPNDYAKAFQVLPIKLS
jgi:hypothetical protein